MPGKKNRKKVGKVESVDNSDSEAEVEVPVEKKTKSKRHSSSTDTSNTAKRSKHESDQEGKEKRLRTEIDRLENKKASIKFGKGDFAGISPDEKQYYLDECVADIAKNNKRLDELINPRSSTPTNDEGSVNACENMKKLLEAMKDAKKNKDGVIDLREKLKDKGITGYYDEAELIAERDCYKTTLEYISKKDSDLCKQTKTKRVHRVGGTPGIGKTTFRFYLLWLWVNKKHDWLNMFDVVHFSDAEWVYTITRSEEGEFGVTLKKYETLLHPGRERTGLGLLEAPEKLSVDKTLFGMKALILTGSPERFLKGNEIYKVSPAMTYLVLWTFKEAEFLVSCKVLSQEQLEERFETYGGVLRLLMCEPQDAGTLIRDALKNISADFIESIFTGVIPQSMSVFIHLLVDLTADGEVKGFISEKVFYLCKEAAEKRNDHLNKTFIERIENKGYLGCIFELKFRSYFAAGGTLQTSKKTIKLKKQDHETFSSNCVAKVGVLYQPDKSNFHGLDFFFLDENNVLYMLQTTVSETGHSPLKFDHADIKGLLSRFRTQNLSITSYAIVYVLPLKSKTTKFKVPQPKKLSKELQKQTTSVVGWPATALTGFE